MFNGSLETIFSSALALAVPLLLAAVGECLVERSGVINIGVEGQMLMSAFAAVSVAHLTGSVWAGAAAAMLIGTAAAVVFAAVTIYRGANQVIAGSVMNLFAYGVTGSLFHSLTTQLAAAGKSRLAAGLLPSVTIPLPHAELSAPVTTYLAIVCAPLAAWWLFRTRAGLRLRAAGENPSAADASGAAVRRIRLGALAAGGLLSGLAGTALTLGHVPAFSDNMTGGKGFVALALVIFGRYHPAGIAAGVAFFSLMWGGATLMASRGHGRPEEVFLLALPPAATLLALALVSRRSAAPAALGQPYPG